ncbi:hypothetical protein FH972_025903 [Carpinus fangiana]|uniref:Endoplasmic reticulum oxidoreductin 1 n=1 Tax=Carpinus fangiana TaxID=176857 RepID=A0A5N6L3C5_9ROSI|nr:hypothetical protein FH972_025903 [Carpinus fangiana]
MALSTPSTPKVDIQLSLDPSTHSYSRTSPPTFTLRITSRAETPITLYTWKSPLDIPRAFTSKGITITNSTTGDSIQQSSVTVQRGALKRIRGTADEQYFVTLHPNTPLELSTGFGRGGGGVQPQPKSVDELLQGYNRERNLKEVRKPRLATGVDGLEPSCEYTISLNHEALQKIWWAPVDREEVLVSDAGEGSYVQDYPWEKDPILGSCQHAPAESGNGSGQLIESVGKRVKGQQVPEARYSGPTGGLKSEVIHHAVHHFFVHLLALFLRQISSLEHPVLNGSTASPRIDLSIRFATYFAHISADHGASGSQKILSGCIYACASYSTLDTLNTYLRPSIHALTQTTDFFSYYRLNLYDKECPFWSDESSMCGNIACAVNTIENEEDVPKIWRAEELGKLEGARAQHPDRKLQKERQEKPLLGELGEDVGESCVVEYDDECDERDYCVPEDESATAKGDYVSLIDNPERFTGYAGPGAHQVWEAIYRENCFAKKDVRASPNAMQGLSGLHSMMRDHEKHQALALGIDSSYTGDDLELDDECLEKRVFYRVVSGMHASISTHLCYDYLNKTTGTWGPNVECYRERLHDHPERVSNLYFNYALVLRAVAKARTSLQDYTFCSGDPRQDRATKKLVLSLADKISRGPVIYDESLMWKDDSATELKDDFRNRFRNVSRTMDCVGCDKCRLWGKLQTAGYGTALKILFEFDEKDPASNPPLRRTEVVALMNTLDKISAALSALNEFHGMVAGDHQHASPNLGAAPIAAPKIITPKKTHDDDGKHDKDDGLDHEPIKYDTTFMEDFWIELDLVWRTMFWVLEGWYHAPATLLSVAWIELKQWWNFWLGLPSYETTWEWRRPPSREDL